MSTNLKQLINTVSTVIIGQEETLKLALTCFTARGHLLIEDQPGRGKTSLLKALSHCMSLEMQRIQFTNDLLPSDIIGSTIYKSSVEDFEFQKGPLFANFVLGDEINRASPKTQSACLQAMEEGCVSLQRQTYSLPSPFFFAATQNPFGSLGTFPLPDSQLDRFLMRVEMGLPTRDQEKSLLGITDINQQISKLPRMLSSEDILKHQSKAESVHVSDALLNYLMNLIEHTRKISAGLSPRAAQGFLRAAKAYAYISERDFVIPEDLQAVGQAVMSHRLHTDDGDSSSDLAKETLHAVALP